ncbi:MAG: tol-pal system-associated acyl-CoA thioesterase [Spirochaetia bacterium]|nr:tol-pal system-associated acyl-CoA thioesterase [Spirochaetia bacterium]
MLEDKKREEADPGASASPGNSNIVDASASADASQSRPFHTFDVRVYYSDTDAGGIVYHSRYLDMAEHARTEFIRDLGIEQQQHLKEKAFGFIVHSLSIDFHEPAVLDDLLRVETRVLSLKRFSIILEQRIKRGGNSIADIRIKVACVSLQNGRPQPLPEEWFAAMKEQI